MFHLVPSFNKPNFVRFTFQQFLSRIVVYHVISGTFSTSLTSYRTVSGSFSAVQVWDCFGSVPIGSVSSALSRDLMRIAQVYTRITNWEKSNILPNSSSRARLIFYHRHENNLRKTTHSSQTMRNRGKHSCRNRNYLSPTLLRLFIKLRLTAAHYPLLTYNNSKLN